MAVEHPSNTAFLTVTEAAPLENVGWTLRVLSDRNFASVMAHVDTFVSMGFTLDHSDVGGGQVELDADLPLLSGPLPLGESRRIVDQQALWQVLEDGLIRMEWLAEDVDEDHITEDGQRAVRIAGRGTGSVLSWAPVLPPGLPTPSTLTREVEAHPMQAWLDVFADAQAEGFIPFVTAMFDHDVDSGGRPWGPAQHLSIPAGGTLLELLTRWCEANELTWRMLPGFRLFVWQEAGNNLSDSVVFTAWRNQREHKRTRTRRELANRVYASSGDTGLAIASDTTSADRWHQRGIWVSAGDALDASARSAVANANLSLHKDEQSSRVVKVEPDRHGRWPITDWTVGDWVRVEVLDDDAASGVVQVMGLAVQVSEDGNVEVEATLQSRIEARALKVQRMLERLGASGASGVAAEGASPIPVERALASVRLSELRDVDLTSPANGSVLQLQGASWVDVTPNLDLLADVDTSTIPPSGTVALAYDRPSGLWRPAEITTGDGGGGGGGGSGGPSRLEFAPPVTGASASGNVTPTKGVLIRATTDCTVTLLGCRMNTTAGRTYRFRVYEMAPTGTTGAVQVGDAVDVASPGTATDVTITVAMSAPLDAGKLYTLTVADTSGSAVASYSHNTAQWLSSAHLQTAWAPSGWVYCATATPVAGTTWTTSTGAYGIVVETTTR